MEAEPFVTNYASTGSDQAHPSCGCAFVLTPIDTGADARASAKVRARSLV